MKRNILTLGVLAFAALGLVADQASAYWWRFCVCSKSPCCTINIRPYNAFSPVCCGTSVWNASCCTNCVAPITNWCPDCPIPAPPASADIRVPNGSHVYVSPIHTQPWGYYGYDHAPQHGWVNPQQPYAYQPQQTPVTTHQTYHQGGWTMPQGPVYWYSK